MIYTCCVMPNHWHFVVRPKRNYQVTGFFRRGVDESLACRKLKQMGQFIPEQLGNQVYAIGVTAYKGTANSWLARPLNVSVQPNGTLEDICHTAGRVNGMIAIYPVDDGGKWLTKKSMPGLSGMDGCEPIRTAISTSWFSTRRCRQARVATVERMVATRLCLGGAKAL